MSRFERDVVSLSRLRRAPSDRRMFLTAAAEPPNVPESDEGLLLQVTVCVASNPRL